MSRKTTNQNGTAPGEQPTRLTALADLAGAVTVMSPSAPEEATPALLPAVAVASIEADQQRLTELLRRLGEQLEPLLRCTDNWSITLTGSRDGVVLMDVSRRRHLLGSRRGRHA